MKTNNLNALQKLAQIRQKSVKIEAKARNNNPLKTIDGKDVIDKCKALLEEHNTIAKAVNIEYLTTLSDTQEVVCKAEAIIVDVDSGEEYNVGSFIFGDSSAQYAKDSGIRPGTQTARFCFSSEIRNLYQFIVVPDIEHSENQSSYSSKAVSQPQVERADGKLELIVKMTDKEKNSQYNTEYLAYDGKSIYDWPRALAIKYIQGKKTYAESPNAYQSIKDKLPLYIQVLENLENESQQVISSSNSQKQPTQSELRTKLINLRKYNKEVVDDVLNAYGIEKIIDATTEQLEEVLSALGVD
jgi:hypothetical protein